MCHSMRVANRKFDSRRHDQEYWGNRLPFFDVPLSKAALAIARQQLPRWCALNNGLTAAELRAYLEDVQSVLHQAGARQGVVRRETFSEPPGSGPARARLRIIK